MPTSYQPDWARENRGGNNGKYGLRSCYIPLRGFSYTFFHTCPPLKVEADQPDNYIIARIADGGSNSWGK